MITIQYDPTTNEISDIKNNIHFDQDKKTIEELIHHWEMGKLNLNPVFQRESVWSISQRRKLIKSIYENVPIPSIFLYEREDKGRTIYDVIDGKQRLETIFQFMGVKGYKRKSFWFTAEWMEEGDYKHQNILWKHLSYSEQNKIYTYPIQTITVKGSQSDISEIFVRINSTGSSLKPQEIRNAKYLQSDFLKEVHRIAKKKWVNQFFINERVMTQNQIVRQKDVELISELFVSMHNGGPVNKKRAIEDAMKSNSINGRHLSTLSRQFLEVLKTIRRIFPKLKQTRFNGLADFYTLFVLVWKWKYQLKLVLTDKRTNNLVQDYLIQFGKNIDEVRDKQKQLKKIEDNEQGFADYLRTVLSSTDELSQRRKREVILDGLLSDCFTVKDPYRSFNKEQRRIIWTNSNGRCKVCNKKLTFNNFHADHIKAYAKGGRTSLNNAQVLCVKHNLEKSDK